MKFSIFLLVLLCISPVIMTPVMGHGGEKDESEPIQMSLEMILLITIAVGILLLIVLSSIIGIEDRRFLIKIGIISLILLGLDYTYIKYFK